MDSTEIPVYGQREQSAYNGHFESTCYHPLLLFNREGDCQAAKLRPGNVHSADDWEELLLGLYQSGHAAQVLWSPPVAQGYGGAAIVSGRVYHHDYDEANSE
jgi:hypothetical protein